MDTYRIPLVWQMYGHCDVDANSLEDAIEIALGPDTPLPEVTAPSGPYAQRPFGIWPRPGLRDNVEDEQDRVLPQSAARLPIGLW